LLEQAGGEGHAGGLAALFAVCLWQKGPDIQPLRGMPGILHRNQLGTMFPGGVDRLCQHFEQFEPFFSVLDLGNVDLIRVKGHETRLAAKGEREGLGVVGDDARQSRQIRDNLRQ